MRLIITGMNMSNLDHEFINDIVANKRLLKRVCNFYKKAKNEYVVHDGSTDELRLRLSLLDCGNTSVITEAAGIRLNALKLFLKED